MFTRILNKTRSTFGSGSGRSVSTLEEIDSVRSGSGYRATRLSKVRDIAIRTAFMSTKDRVSMYAGIDADKRFVGVPKRHNLYAICMPSGHGKTTLAKELGCIDVDDLVPGQESNRVLAWMVDPKSQAGMEWPQAINKTLDKMHFSEPTIVLVHDMATCEAIGATRVANVVVSASAVAYSTAGRSRELRKLERVTCSALVGAKARGTFMMKDYVAAAKRVAKIMNAVQMSVPNPADYGVVGPVSYDDVGTYTEIVRDGEPSFGNLLELEQMYLRGSIPHVAVSHYASKLEHTPMPMTLYARLACAVAHMPLAHLARTKRGVLKKSLLWDKFNLGEHIDAVEMDAALVRSSDSFSNAAVLWWKMVGQNMECAHELHKLIVGVQETQWATVMKWIANCSSTGVLGCSRVYNKEVVEMDAAVILGDNGEYGCSSDRRKINGLTVMENEVLSKTASNVRTFVDVPALMDHVARGCCGHEATRKYIEETVAMVSAMVDVTGSKTDVSPLDTAVKFKLAKVVSHVAQGGDISNDVAANGYISIGRGSRKNARTFLLSMSHAYIDTAMLAMVSEYVNATNVVQLLEMWLEYATCEIRGPILMKASLSRAIALLTRSDSVSLACNAVTLMLAHGIPAREVEVLSCNIMRNCKGWNNQADAMALCMQYESSRFKVLGAGVRDLRLGVHNLVCECAGFGDGVCGFFNDAVDMLMAQLYEQY